MNRLATGTAQSAVRKALDQVNEAQRLEPITAEEVAALGEVTLWGILVEPYIPRYSGSLVLTDSIDSAERICSKIGRILQIGPLAFMSKTSSGLDLSTVRRPQVGEYYLFEMYAGQEMKTRGGHDLRLVSDTELKFRVSDPELFKGYI